LLLLLLLVLVLVLRRLLALRSRLLLVRIGHAGLRKVQWGGRVGRGRDLRGHAGKFV
jgi:hypothetical protein